MIIMSSKDSKIEVQLLCDSGSEIDSKYVLKSTHRKGGIFFDLNRVQDIALACLGRFVCHHLASNEQCVLGLASETARLCLGLL